MADAKKHQPAESRWLNKRLGKFRLLSLLGQGAMGKVFLAEDTTLKRQVALKVVATSKDDPKAQAKAQQFVREARAAAKLNHPSIVNVLEIDQQKDLLYIAMDLVQGGDVKQLIKNSGRIAPAKACDLAADAADALAFGHRLGVIHRDVKPSNLMLTREGRCKLADFGLADLGDPNDDFRMPDGIIGTPSTIAPEVARGQPAQPASDQYSLGCTVWYMLTGQPIFSGKNVREVLIKQANEPTPSLAEHCPDLPDVLIQGIETALSKDPEERHADCEVFARLLRGHSIAMGPAGSSMSLSSASLAAVMPPAAGRRQKTPWLIAGASVAALALGGGAMIAFSGNNHESPPATPAESQSLEAESVARVTAPETEALEETTATTTTTTEPPPPIETASVPPTPFPPPATEPAAVNADVLEFTADQTQQIKPLVADDTVVSVTGRVQSAQLSQSGKTFMVKFEGNGRGDFQVIWKPSAYEKMGTAFGGSHGEQLAGQRIRVTGELSSMFGTPQIQVTSPEQIEMLD